MQFSIQTRKESLWCLQIWNGSPHLTSHNSDSSHASVSFLLPVFLCFNSFPSSQLQTYIWRFDFWEAPSTESSNAQPLWLSGHKYKSRYLYPATSPLFTKRKCCSQFPQGRIYPQDWHFKLNNAQFMSTVLKDNKYSVLNYWMIHLI